MIGAITFASIASAAPITWSLSAAYDDGVTASGYYDFDADTGAFTNISITTSLAETLSFGNQISPSDPGFLLFTADEFGANGTPVYSFDLAESMTSAGGTIDILESVLTSGTGFSFGGLCAGDPECLGSTADRSVISGSVSAASAAVPLPAGGALLLTALAAFGAFRRFGKDA